MASLTVENIRVIMEELLVGYKLIKGGDFLARTEEESEYSEEEYSEEDEEHARKLKRIEETLGALEAQVNRIALMQEKRLATFGKAQIISV
jgi:hypothetical protein